MNAILEGLKGRSYLSTADFSTEELQALLDLAIKHKQGEVDPGKPLAGKNVGLLFFNPSLRTRTSMEIAVQQLGGITVVLEVGKGMWGLEYRDGVVMNEDKAEHIKEAAPVLSSYLDGLAVRCFPMMNDYQEDRQEPILSAFQKHATVPLLNMESATQHPMQSMADMLTIQEKFGSLKGRKVTLSWAYHPKALPMAVSNSFALAAAQNGMDITIAAPPEFELAPELTGQLEELAGKSGGSVQTSHDLPEASKDAEIIYAKSWGSYHYYGRLDEERALREQYKHWQITGDVMKNTKDGYFMHCLPVRRNVVVADEVLDSPNSIVIQQASNRLHFQKTMMSVLLSS